VFGLWKTNKSTEQLALIRFIVSRFGYRPKEITYFEHAITHPSALREASAYSYERLEFLGDSIIDAIVAEFLYKRFPSEDEGYLTQIKSRIVGRKVHLDIAQKMKLTNILRYQKGRNINADTLGGNAFEAIIGAIFLDAGYEQTKKCLLQHVFRKYADINQLLKVEYDFKSKLIIWCQQHKLRFQFIVVDSKQATTSQWIYHIEVEINGKRYGKGVGANKKAAQQMAAQETLTMIDEMGGRITQD